MTRIANLIKQGAELRARAVEHTGDINEGYLLVHGVMARAWGRDEPANLDLALMQAFESNLAERDQALVAA